MDLDEYTRFLEGEIMKLNVFLGVKTSLNEIQEVLPYQFFSILARDYSLGERTFVSNVWLGLFLALYAGHSPVCRRFRVAIKRLHERLAVRSFYRGEMKPGFAQETQCRIR